MLAFAELVLIASIAFNSALYSVYYMHVVRLVLIASIAFDRALCFCLLCSIELILFDDEFSQELSSRLSCLQHVAKLVQFNDELSQELSRKINSTMQRVAELCFRS